MAPVFVQFSTLILLIISKKCRRKFDRKFDRRGTLTRHHIHIKTYSVMSISSWKWVACTCNLNIPICWNRVFAKEIGYKHMKCLSNALIIYYIIRNTLEPHPCRFLNVENVNKWNSPELTILHQNLTQKWTYMYSFTVEY